MRGSSRRRELGVRALLLTGGLGWMHALESLPWASSEQRIHGPRVLSGFTPLLTSPRYHNAVFLCCLWGLFFQE